MKILKNKKHVNGFTFILAITFLSVFAALVVSMATANSTTLQNQRDARTALSAARFGLEISKYFVQQCDIEANSANFKLKNSDIHETSANSKPKNSDIHENSANLKIKNSDIHAAWKSLCDSIIASPLAVVPANNDRQFKDDVTTGKELVIAPFKYGSGGVTFTLRFYKYNQVIDPNISFSVESTGSIGDLSRTVAMDFEVVRDISGNSVLIKY